ncbi:MAG: sigma-70 family RNA polymerase sigma factor [Planctomycetota bacterium]
MQDPSPIPIEQLLEHRAWVRSLARRVVGDEASADDLEQQTWLAAMERPPRGSTPRAWLGTVVRNLASKMRRSESRLNRREAHAARVERTPSTSELVAEAEAHRLVVEAVLSIDAPHRDAVLLRFFEGLAPPEVGARLGIPLETARARIRRGIGKVRGHLDRRQGGDGTRWRLALAPLVATAGTNPALGVGAALGVALMNTKLLVAAGVLGVVSLAGTALWKIAGPSTPSASDNASTPLADPRGPEQGKAAQEASHGVELRGSAADLPPPPRPKWTRVASDGRVAVVARLRLPDGSVPESGTIHWATTPDFPTPSLRRAGWSRPESAIYVQPGEMWFFATGGKREVLKSAPRRLVVSSQGPIQELDFALQEGPGVHGSVVLPGRFKRPRLKVTLRAFPGSQPPAKPIFEATDPSAEPNDRDGLSFVFRDLAPGGYLLGLSLGGSDYPVVETLWVTDAMVETDLVLERLDPARYMEVHVLGPDGKPIEEAQISVSFSGNHASVAGGNVSLQREDGAFIVDHIPEHTLAEDGTWKEGVFTVHVRTRDHGEVVRPYDPATTSALTIRIAEMDTLVVRVTNPPGYASEGKLQVALRAQGETGVRNPRLVESDGTVTFGKVQPGAYEVVVLGPGLTPATIHPFEFRPGAGELVIPAPVFYQLVVRVPRDAAEPSFSLRRHVGKERWRVGWPKNDGQGEFLFEMLAAGTYTLEGHYGERWVKREVQIPAEDLIRLD